MTAKEAAKELKQGDIVEHWLKGRIMQSQVINVECRTIVTLAVGYKPTIVPIDATNIVRKVNSETQAEQGASSANIK